jgi:hypothetical protein
MPVWRPNQKLRGPLPLPRHDTLIRNVPNPHSLNSLNTGIAIPSQEPPEPIRQYNPPHNISPDIVRVSLDEMETQGLPFFDPNHDTQIREIRHPGGIRMTNYSGIAPHGNYKLFQVFPSRPDRKRFTLCNPDVAGGGSGDTMYFTFKNSPNALLPLYPGQTWDESGSEICVDDIWICFPTKGDPYIAYEGRLHGAYES